jgi:hypothetical protein
MGWTNRRLRGGSRGAGGAYWASAMSFVPSAGKQREWLFAVGGTQFDS